MIRRATASDVDRIVQMGVRFIRESTYREHIAPDVPSMTVFVTGLVDGLRSAVFVDELNGKLIAMIGLLIYRHPMSGLLVAVEPFWWVEPECRGGRGVRLFLHGRKWAKDMGATSIQMIAPTPEVAAIYERLGLAKVETTYAGAL